MSSILKKEPDKPESTVVDALRVIDNEALRIALVVNDEQQLLGVVTDGDIRRGLLNNLPLETPVVDIMSRSPITASVNTAKEQLVKLMESKSILAVPLMEENKVVGLETLHHLFEEKTYHNPVFIMAGGM